MIVTNLEMTPPAEVTTPEPYAPSPAVYAAVMEAARDIEWLDDAVRHGETVCCRALYQVAEAAGANVNTIKGAYRALGIRYVYGEHQNIADGVPGLCVCRWMVSRP